MDVILPAIIGIGLLAAIIAGGIWIVRAVIRRTAGKDAKSIYLGLVAALATALSVFVLVYLSAWAEMRQQVAMADIAPHELDDMRSDFRDIREELSDYSHKHAHFPDSLQELPDFKADARMWKDMWGNPYQYTKTANGYRLLSLGRDGKPGGVGLDADIDSEQEWINLEPTLSQFLFEALGRRTLFTVALVASFFAGVTCYIASGPRKDRATTAVAILLSMAVAIVGAVIVSLALVSFYLIGNHH